MLIFGRFDGSVLQSTTDEECMFLFNWLLSMSVQEATRLSLVLPPDNNFLYS